LKARVNPSPSQCGSAVFTGVEDLVIFRAQLRVEAGHRGDHIHPVGEQGHDFLVVLVGSVVQSAISLQVQSLFDVGRCPHAHVFDACQLAGVSAVFGLVVNDDTYQLQLGVRGDQSKLLLANASRVPLHDSVRHAAASPLH
jgi:hypothetical protein